MRLINIIRLAERARPPLKNSIVTQLIVAAQPPRVAALRHVAVRRVHQQFSAFKILDYFAGVVSIHIYYI